MDHIFREKVYESDGYNGGGGSLREKANTALGFGIAGSVLGGAALLSKGGLSGLLGGIGAGAPAPVNVTCSGGGWGGPSTFDVYAHECSDILDLTKTVYDLKIGTLVAAQQARNVDVNEKFQLYKSQIDADFGLYISNRDNIDKVNDRINNELFSLYKYTRDKDDVASAKIYDVAKEVEVISKVRPYQDKLIMCEIEKNFAWLKNYIDSKTCRMIEGVNVLPLTPEVTGVYSQNCCNQFRIAAAGGGGGAAA